jgi:polyisoprenoid-binding protein YceI
MSTTQPTAAVPTRDLDGLAIPLAGRYDIDASHTSVGFVARHLMVSKVRGRFGTFDGHLTIAEEPLDSAVEVAIGAASIDTRAEDRDAHLRSPDFLDVERYPQLAFRSTAVRHAGGNRFEVDGDLTIKDVTRPVRLDVEIDGLARDPWGGERIGFSASTEIDRELWGLTWNVALETGGVLVSKQIRIEIEGEAVRAA